MMGIEFLKKVARPLKAPSGVKGRADTALFCMVGEILGLKNT